MELRVYAVLETWAVTEDKEGEKRTKASFLLKLGDDQAGTLQRMVGKHGRVHIGYGARADLGIDLDLHCRVLSYHPKVTAKKDKIFGTIFYKLVGVIAVMDLELPVDEADRLMKLVGCNVSLELSVSIEGERPEPDKQGNQQMALAEAVEAAPQDQVETAMEAELEAVADARDDQQVRELQEREAGEDHDVVRTVPALERRQSGGRKSRKVELPDDF